MSPIQTKTTIFFAVNGFVMTTFAILAAVLYVYGQCIEPYVFGYVVHIPPADHIWRGYVTRADTKREVEVGCFRLHDLRKLAPAIQPRYAFNVETAMSDRINVSAYVADATRQDTGQGLETHKVGDVWDRSYCFEMPGTIGDAQPIRVSGHSEHVRLLFGKPFPLWKSITPVPEFIIPALR